jgi:hypothetical protein
VVTVPDKWLNEVRQLIHRFVTSFWPFPSWNTICQKRNQGGLNIVNVHQQQLALQLVYIQRLAREDTKQDFCTPIVRDLFQYYSGTLGWDNIGRLNGNIKRTVNNIPCLATLCNTFAKLPAIPVDNEPANWCLQLSPTASPKITEASPGDFRRTLHPDHHWFLSPPAPPLKIPLGWRLPQSVWKSFWRIKMPHKATTIWWRLLQDCLSTKERIQCRSTNLITNSTCLHCSQGIETDHHFFLGCPTKDHIWLDLWPGPSFPPSQQDLWTLIISPNSKEDQLLSWTGKVLLAIWISHWQCHHNNNEWNKEAAIAAFYRLV